MRTSIPRSPIRGAESRRSGAARHGSGEGPAGPAVESAGLDSEQARRRLESEGPNELARADRRSAWRIALGVLGEPMFGLLLGAGFLYLLLGDLAEASVLLAFSSLSISIAAVQETRSEKVLEALRDLSSPRATVIRDGEPRRVPGREVVRGDLVVVAEGDRVVADGVLVVGEGIEIDESLLTGESMPVAKVAATASVPPARAPGADDPTALYSGTLVVRGGGRFVVTATGGASQIGRIGGSLASIETEPPRLRTQTKRLVLLFGAAGASASLAVVVLLAHVGEPLVEAMLAGIAVGMSLLPEEFPLVLAVFTVMGAWRISRIGVLTRQAAAIESLGSATVLCTDKTGTLTYNRMTVSELRPAGASDSGRHELLEAAELAVPRDAPDPMDRAIVEAQRSDLGGRASSRDSLEPVATFAVSAELRATTVAYRDRRGGGVLAAVKGAPEDVFGLCRADDEGLGEARGLALEMAREGVRVLAVAMAEGVEDVAASGPRAWRFRYLGLIGFADPLRESVPHAVADCHAAGVRVVMMTGDHPATAAAVARQAGIHVGEVVVGDDLAAMDDAQLLAASRAADVFARIRPEQKLRLVRALVAAGEVVAMTGDGVNDAPALKAAHIGVAMGGRGTDVAREAASIVLLDDDFASIVETIRLGRRIYDNLRKAMGYVIALHVPIAMLSVLPLMFGMPLLLTPMIVASLEMIIDPVCSVVLEAEPEEADVMARPPREPKSALLPMTLMAWCGFQGIAALAAVLAAAWLTGVDGSDEGLLRSAVFVPLVTTNVALIFVNRSFRSSLVDAIARPNPLLWRGLATVAVILAVLLGTDTMRTLFHLGPVSSRQLLASFGAGLALFFSLEAVKPLIRRVLRA